MKRRAVPAFFRLLAAAALFLPAPYGNARFYKAFAMGEDDPPPDEGRDP